MLISAKLNEKSAQDSSCKCFSKVYAYGHLNDFTEESVKFGDRKIIHFARVCEKSAKWIETSTLNSMIQDQIENSFEFQSYRN